MIPHTPGPWQVNSGMVETAKGVPIARMDRTPGNGTQPVERDANAYLIAAVPTLLAAAKDALLLLQSIQEQAEHPDAMPWPEMGCISARPVSSDEAARALRRQEEQD